jgi:hypothetical protein
LAAKENAVLLPVKVVPGASKTRLLGEWDGRAKIAVAGVAEKGKANESLIEFVAELLGVRRNAVTLVRGRTSPLKTLRIDGVMARHVQAVLAPARS